MERRLVKGEAVVTRIYFGCNVSFVLFISWQFVVLVISNVGFDLAESGTCCASSWLLLTFTFQRHHFSVIVIPRGGSRIFECVCVWGGSNLKQWFMRFAATFAFFRVYRYKKKIKISTFLQVNQEKTK